MTLSTTKRKSGAQKVCELQGCDKPAREYGHICPMHYHRMWRTGSYDKKVRKPEVYTDSSGYLCLNGEGVHRHVYREAHGDSVPDCWGCGCSLSWDMGKRMHIDHINENKADNNIKNLRASCWMCNVSRSSHRRGTTLTVGDRTMNISSWAKEPDVRVPPSCIRQRKRRGMSDYDALFTKRMTHNSNQRGQRNCLT